MLSMISCYATDPLAVYSTNWLTEDPVRSTVVINRLVE